MPYPQFHFLMLAAGEVLKNNKFVTPKDIQEKIFSDNAFNVKVPLEDCQLALTLLTDAGLLERYDSYRWMKPDAN